MPQPLTALEESAFLQLLLMGPPGVGKTSAAIVTSPWPVRVFLCESDSALFWPLQVLRDEGLSESEIAKRVTYERITGEKSMLTALATARSDAEEHKIKTVVLDPLTFFANNLLEETLKLTLTQGNNEDGRRAHPEATRRMSKVMFQLLRLPCNVVVVTHYLDVGDAAKGGGEGKVPMLPNKEMRAHVGAIFPNRVWMDMRGERRCFVTTPKGAWGPGCRGLKGSEEIDADVGALMRALKIPGAPKASLQKPQLKTQAQAQSKSIPPKQTVNHQQQARR
jgi:hypothetical protein